MSHLPKPIIKCPKCGYRGKPEIRYIEMGKRPLEDGRYKWYCPKCGEYQK